MLLVLASARSGTTSLGALLDLHPGVTFVGELNRRRGWLEGQAHPCLRPALRRVPGLGADSRPSAQPHAPPPGRPTTADTAGRPAPEIRELQVAGAAGARSVVRPLLGLPTAGQCRYVAYVEQLYRGHRGAGRRAGHRRHVEAEPGRHRAVASLGALPSEVVHLHRDPRGRRGVAGRAAAAPHESPRPVPRRRAARLASPDRRARRARPGTASTASGAAARRASAPGRVLRLPYEDLVADSSGTVGRCSAGSASIPTDLADAWSGARPSSTVPTNHSMAGNRARRTRGPTPLVADDRWRDDLHPAFRVLVEALTGAGAARPAPAAGRG